MTEWMPRTVTTEQEEARTEQLAQLSELAQNPSIERALDAVRELLEMDVAYATEITEFEQIFKTMRGDAESFGVAEGGSMPIEQTYCHKVLAGRLPNVNPDIRADERAASMPITEAADVGAFVSVPLRLSDGSHYGTLCAASHRAREDLGYRELQFLHVFARIIVDQIERDALDGLIRDTEVQTAAASALIAAVHARDSYTAEHSREVVDKATAVARRLGMGEDEVSDVAQVALLHDIGKIAVPDAILCKAGPLNQHEWEQMRLHPVHGERMIHGIPELSHLAPAIRAEHERWDGTGYPDGLAGEQIPIASRITLVCDAYHAMTSDRPYRDALSPSAARAAVAASIGSQFCPTAGAALLELLA
jgi:HD-GYP domain-containing protein (c-di-GMP phosphodiesterase class II)